MNQIELNRKANNLILRMLNVGGVAKFAFVDARKYSPYLKKNASLMNSAKEKSVYIIGNGPSVKALNLNQLVGRNIITVNKSIVTPIYELLKPKFHVVLDKEILSQVADAIEDDLVNDKSKTTFILHRSAAERFGKYDRAHIVYGTHQAATNKLRCDLTSNVTTFMNVLPFAALLSIAVGYKKIILLGNDFSFFAARKDVHFYEIGENVVRKESMYQELSGCSIALLEYRNLYKYAKNRGVELVNATENSLLDEIPQVSLNDYL